MFSFIGLVTPLASPREDNTFAMVCRLVAHAYPKCTKTMHILSRPGFLSDRRSSFSVGKIDSPHFNRGKRESAPGNLLDGLKGSLFGGIRRNQIGKICIFK